MAAAAIVKKTQKSRYHSSGLTHLREIWHDYTKLVPYTAQIVKKFEFPKSKMADGRHFENR